MENASKALLIAASVLIVIILISFGMIMLNSAQDTVEDAQGVGESISDASQIALGKVEASFNKDGTIDIRSILTPEQIEGKEDITSKQLAKIILGDEEKSLGSYNDNWRIIGQNVVEDGRKYKYKLVSTENVINDVKLGHFAAGQAIVSYYDSVEKLNAVTKESLTNILSNDKVKLRSINLADIEVLFNITEEEKKQQEESKYGKVYKYYYKDEKIYSQEKYSNGNYGDEKRRGTETFYI